MSFSANTYGISLNSVDFEGQPVEVMLNGTRGVTSDKCYHGGGEMIRCTGVSTVDNTITIDTPICAGTILSGEGGVARNILIEVPAGVVAALASEPGPFRVIDPIQVSISTTTVAYTKTDQQGWSALSLPVMFSEINPSTGVIRNTYSVPTGGAASEKLFAIYSALGQSAYVQYDGLSAQPGLWLDRRHASSR